MKRILVAVLFIALWSCGPKASDDATADNQTDTGAGTDTSADGHFADSASGDHGGSDGTVQAASDSQSDETDSPSPSDSFEEGETAVATESETTTDTGIDSQEPPDSEDPEARDSQSDSTDFASETTLSTDSKGGDDTETAVSQESDSAQDLDTGWFIDPQTGEPAGYAHWRDWQGCVWTRTDELDIATTVTPVDFRDHTAFEPFCISGEIGAGAEERVALGFNTSEPPTNADCSAGAQLDAPHDPGVSPRVNGIGFDILFNRSGPQISFEILGEGGMNEPTKRWCTGRVMQAKEGEAQFFLSYDQFDSSCGQGDGGGDDGAAYNGEPISAVVLNVHGEADTKSTFDICLKKLEESRGYTFDDSPFDPVPSGIIGGNGGEDADYERRLISMQIGESYILQNNYMGKESGCQTLAYDGDRFEIIEFSGSRQSDEGPISFPSFYVGQNGNQALTTLNTDNLPKMLDEISSAVMTFRRRGLNSDLGSDQNAGYIPAVEMWISSDNPPYAGREYGVPVSGRIALWLVDDPVIQPEGAVDGTVDFCGVDWDVWGGGSGAQPDFPDIPADNPYITYVARQAVYDLSQCDLKAAIQDAVTLNPNGYSLDGRWYLTDVIAGFQISELLTYPV